MKKRLFPLLLSLALCLGLTVPTTLAAGDFEITDGVLTKYTGPGGDVVIPDGVTSIREEAFYECESLTSVTIPEGVTYIGKFAFAGCKSLTSVTIPDSVRSIDPGPFKDCRSLTSITVGDGNKKFASEDGILFDKSKAYLLQYPGGRTGTYEIPAGVTHIGEYSFYQCEGLTGVTIPDGVIYIGEAAFQGCLGLTSVTIPEGVPYIGSLAFAGCKGLTSVAIPNSVTAIGGYTFWGCMSLSDMTIPDGMTYIEVAAFAGTALTSVTIPNSVTRIGDGAFNYCENLTSITVESGNKNYTSVDGVLFDKSKVCLLQYPGGRTGTYEIPAGVTRIEGWSFANSSLTSVTIPDSVTEMGSVPFEGSRSLISITVGDGNKDYTSEDGVLFDKSKARLLQYPGGRTGTYEIPAGVTDIGYYAFHWCEGLTSVIIPEGVTSIDVGAFAGCKALTRVTIPDSVTFIGSDAFIENTTIYGTEGSYAQTWAAKYGYTFKTTSAHLAYASTQPVLVDGSPVELQAYALKDESGKPTNYVKLRDVAFILNGTPAQFDVGWDGAVNMETGKAYVPNGSEMTTPYSGDRAYETAGAETRINGSPAALEAIVLTDDRGGAYTYYKLRDLGQALGFNVGWSKTDGIFIETGKPYDPNN